MPTKRMLKKVAKNAATNAAVLTCEQDVLARKNADGTVAIMRLDNDEHFFVLDGMAAEVWAMINGNTPLATIKASLVKKHRPPMGRFERDVTRLVQELLDEKLVRL